VHNWARAPLPSRPSPVTAAACRSRGGCCCATGRGIAVARGTMLSLLIWSLLFTYPLHSGGRACASLAVCTARLRACCSRCRPSRLLHNRLECRSAARMPLGRRSASVGGGRAASSRRWRAAEDGLLVQRRAGWGCVTARWGRGRRAHRQKIPVNARTCVNPGPSPTLSHLLAAAQHLLRGITTARPACWPRGASHLSGASSRTWCALPATPCPAMLGGAVEAAAHPGGWQPIPLELPHVTAPIGSGIPIAY
jgi:hypothetical protein